MNEKEAYDLIKTGILELKKLIFSSDAPVKDENTTEEVKHEDIKTELASGDVIYSKGELKAGVEVYMISADGTKINAPEGEHKTDKLVIKVVNNEAGQSVIDSIVTIEEAPVAEIKNDKDENIEILKNSITELIEIVKKQSEQIAKNATDIKDHSEKILKYSKTPVEDTPAKIVPEKELSFEKQVKQERINRLNSI